MSQELRKRLEETARTLKQPKNRIIVKALEEHLQGKQRAALAAEARRQSLLVSAGSAEDEEFWEKQSDTSAWQ
jgi:predicted transcriptional regulator